ncbi:MAG: putative lipid II flippase FtsW [Planctomycetes bacterium]|nr:putative lipid II flippase FtsW [Planctomycetota bacterium]
MKWLEWLEKGSPPPPQPGGARRGLPAPREILLVCVILLLTLSTVMVFSAGAFYWSVDDSFFFLKRQLLWLPIAGLVGLLFSLIDYRLYRRYYLAVLGSAAVLLVLVLIPQVGRTVNHSRRWLPLGGLQFQPSELAKVAVVMLVAGFLSNRPERMRSFLRGFIPLCFAVLGVVGLILLEPDLGTAVFVFALAVGLMLIAGMKIFYLLASAGAFVPVLAIYLQNHWETVERRFQGLLDSEGVYQIRHSLIALGSGGLDGVGLGASVQKLRYLPEAHTDFILAVIGEELGYLGCLGVILLFAVLVGSGAAIALRAKDRFGFLLASGITMSIGYQALVNIAVVTGSAPTKGMSLPLVTFGGSGLCMTLAQIGILVSVARISESRAASGEGCSGEPADTG